jgi:hypothetical protein
MNRVLSNEPLIRAPEIDLDVDAWSRLITGGLEQHVIHLPDRGR